MKDYIQIKGKEFILDKKQIIFRGVNLGNWLLLESQQLGIPSIDYKIRESFAQELGTVGTQFWDKFTENFIADADFAYMKSLGINFVRLPFNYKILEDDMNPGCYKDDGFRLLDKAIEMAKKYKMYVQLDLHAAPGGQATDPNDDIFHSEAMLWTDYYYQKRTIDLWGAIAKRYKDEPTVMGYCLLNEPVCYDKINYNDELLCQLYQKIIDNIRRYDKNHIIILEANHWSERIESLSDSLFEDSLVTYQPHNYPARHLTDDELREYPTNKFNKDWLRKILEETVDKKRIVRPVIYGEFGLRFDKDIGYKLLEDIIDIFEEHGWSWATWCYKNLQYHFGYVTLKKDTPWMKFVSRPDVVNLSKKLKTLVLPNFEDWNKSQPKFFNELANLYPNVENERIGRALYATYGQGGFLALLEFLHKLRSYSDKEILEMAKSFKFENCTVYSKAIKVLKPYYQKNQS